MFCPVCKAEYRDGYFHCADCDMDLVASLKKLPSDAGEHDPFVPVWSGSEPEFTDVCGVLRDSGIPFRVVDSADFLFHIADRAAQVILVPPSMKQRAQEALVVYTDEEPEEGQDEDASDVGELTDDEQNANDIPPIAGLRRRRILKKLVGQGWPNDKPEESWREILEPRGDDPETLRRYPVDPDRWDPSNATAEVWSGTDGGAADMIVASLRENGIHWRVDDGSAPQSDEANPTEDEAESVLAAGQPITVFVLPEDEHRAKEIVREISTEEPL